MAKETMIVFVYDTECLKAETDDPVSAVLYFHPSWVSDTQKLALCGQLMGTSYFLKDSFFKARIISLQNGKFILKEFDRFVLAVGTDRNISDHLLEYRANVLTSLVKLYHRDLQTVYDQFPLQSQYKNLAEKLYHIFETYLPILQYRGYAFQNVYKLRVPKTASHIFLEAIQTLQNCQQTKGILGGAILYHNKIVANQLPYTLIKQLILTDPLHIRPTAEHLTSTEFHIPHGVLMVTIYIDRLDYKNLQTESQRAQNLQMNQVSCLSGGPWPFQYNKRKIRRDSSIIFTHIPEEEGTTTTVSEVIENNNESLKKNDNIIEPPQQLNMPIPVRPKSLTLRSVVGTYLPSKVKNNGINKEYCLPESGISSINFDETDSFPEYIGRTSICSTPLAENKVLAVGNIMSICSNTDTVFPAKRAATSPPKLQQRNILKQEFEKFFYNFITNPNKLEKRNSLVELHRTVKKFSKNISLKKLYRSLKSDVNRNCAPNYIENNNNNRKNGNAQDDKQSISSEISDISDNSDENTNYVSRTITDPTYPVFNADGLPISRSLFQEFLEKYYKLWGETGEESETDDDVVQLIEEFKDFDYELKKLDESLRNTNNALKADRNFNLELVTNTNISEKSSPLDKKSLTLPIKSISTATPVTIKEHFGMPSSGVTGGVPLTPLMAKLSILAQNDERDDSNTNYGFQTPLYTSQKTFSVKRSIRNNNNNILPSSSSFTCEEAVDAFTALDNNIANYTMNQDTNAAESQGLQKAELFLCGQQNMTLVLVMEEGSCRQQKIVQDMFDVCVAKFPHMESHLSETLNVCVEAEKHSGMFGPGVLSSIPKSSYSFLCLDDDWDVLQRSGHWSPLEINALEEIHCHLQKSGEGITDIMARSYENVMYGCKTGRTQYFYKEGAKPLSGIPPPSDAMGAVSMKAKNQLEKDHSYVLF